MRDPFVKIPVIETARKYHRHGRSEQDTNGILASIKYYSNHMAEKSRQKPYSCA
jgi:hypothetical protein